MEEKKKRWRPSLTLYRSVVDELSEAKEQLSLQAQGEKCLREELRQSKEKLKVLDRSCDLMSAELTRVRDELVEKNKIIAERNYEIVCLRKRGFLARLFNRDY